MPQGTLTTASETAAMAPAAPVKPGRTRINVVLFSGGSGTQSITEALLRHTQISLKILINAYDDGHSTGRLRKFIPGMLGPSDVRKNLNRLMPNKERTHRALRTISDFRLPVGISRSDALAIVDAVLTQDAAAMPAKIAPAFSDLSLGAFQTLSSFLRSFLQYLHEQELGGRTFDFTDCAIGNLFFAGCYLEQGHDFNRAIAAFSRFHDVDPGILLNVTLGENLFLVAEKESGAVMLNEGDIVAAQDSAKISRIYLLDEEIYRNHVENSSEPEGGWVKLFQRGTTTPGVNPAAAEALHEADVIIYGPGTQHSSLFPSYLTQGVAEAIASNKTADKIFVGNIHRDFDIQTDDANDIARKLLDSMRRGGENNVEWLDVVSHFFVQRTENGADPQAKYVPFDPTKFSFPLETVKARDWEAHEGRHSGGYVLDELQEIVQSRIDIELAQLHHMVSIVIPVLNEERTIEEVLKSVTALDFQPLGLTKEIIVVDGYSTDRTVEIAKSVRNVRVYQLPGRWGRGVALRTGVEKSRGNLVVFFPGDNEYDPGDLYNVVDHLTRRSMRAVFGTRSVKCTDLSGRLRKIYHDNRGLYLTSKYGGILLAVLALLLYNRYITDMLTSLKGFDGRLIRDLRLESNGIDLESEIIAKLSRRKEYVFEIPVDYRARTREQGKKITVVQGVKCVLALFLYRFRK